MQVNFLKKVVNEYGNAYITAQCNKKIVSVAVLPNSVSFPINVCTHNAMHKANAVMTGVGGKWFASFDDAIEAYKSPELKAILEAIRWDRQMFTESSDAST